MKGLDVILRRIEARRMRVLGELHPLLHERVLLVLDDLGGRLAPWCGFRDAKEQEEARAAGNSNARFGESPHNFKPALACDLVLNPALVNVAPHPDEPTLPNLWDTTSPEAHATWEALEFACATRGLERVDLRRGVRDLPHVQLPHWRGFVPT